MARQRPTTLYLVLAVYLALFAASARAAGVVGTGSPTSCTDAALATALTGGGLVTFNCGPGPVVIPVNTHVIGPEGSAIVDGGGLVTLDGEDNRQHFYVLDGASLAIWNIELANGRSFAGGAILNQGSLDVVKATFTGNDAEAFGSGGAIFNDSNAALSVASSQFRFNSAQAGGGAIQNLGNVEIRHSTFENNSAGLDGGAVQNNGGDARIDYSTVSVNFATNGAGLENNGGDFLVRRSALIGNDASGQGGGLRNASGNVTIENTTLVGNEADAGGGIYAEDSVSLASSTLHINKAFAGGAIYRFSASPVTALNSIFSFSLEPGSISSQLNCDGSHPLLSSGHNLSSDNSCNLNLGSDLPATDPLLAPLANNLGPTANHLPLPGSPAIDAGTNVGCPATDQRSAVRPQNGGGGAAICDIGAVEVPEPSLALSLGAGLFALVGVGRLLRSGRAQGAAGCDAKTRTPSSPNERTS